jgi:hypothetical protein
LLSIHTPILPTAYLPVPHHFILKAHRKKNGKLKIIPLGETFACKFLIFVCYMYGFESRSIYFPTFSSMGKHWDRNDNVYVISICRVFKLCCCERVLKSTAEVGFGGNPTGLQWHGKLYIFILNLVNNCVGAGIA